MRSIRIGFKKLVVLGGLIVLLPACAQTTAASVQTLRSGPASNWNAMLQAMEATQSVPAEVVPRFGTFYSALSPMGPPLPADVYNVPDWNLGNGFWLLDDLDQPRTQLRAMEMAAPMMDAGDNDSGSDGNAYGFDTNQLWLEITNVSAGFAYLNLHNATNEVYAIWGTTDLLTGWNVATEIWPTDTNCTPFTVPTPDQPNLFLRAEDWTGVTENGNSTPDWWFRKYYHTTSLFDTNLDSQGNQLLHDYEIGNDPNVILFDLTTTNFYVNSINTPIQLNVLGGVPAGLAVLVNDMNQADAVWQPYWDTDPIWYKVVNGIRYSKTPSDIGTVTMDFLNGSKDNPLFNSGWGAYDPGIPDQRQVITDTQYFTGPSWILGLYDPLGGNTVASDPAKRAQLLAEAIPALSKPVGANLCQNRLLSEKQFDMATQFADSTYWPSSRGSNNGIPKWFHSDMDQIAYPLIHGLYDQLVSIANQ